MEEDLDVLRRYQLVSDGTVDLNRPCVGPVRDKVAEAVAIARAEIIEECAKVAEAAYKSKNLADRSPKHIAAAIRRLRT